MVEEYWEFIDEADLGGTFYRYVGECKSKIHSIVSCFIRYEKYNGEMKLIKGFRDYNLICRNVPEDIRKIVNDKIAEPFFEIDLKRFREQESHGMEI